MDSYISSTQVLHKTKQNRKLKSRIAINFRKLSVEETFANTSSEILLGAEGVHPTVGGRGDPGTRQPVGAEKDRTGGVDVTQNGKPRGFPEGHVAQGRQSSLRIAQQTCPVLRTPW